MLKPAIKWTGSKRSQANKIISYFPKEIKTYYEPFLGGGSVLFALLNSEIKIRHYCASDINSDLISLFLSIRDDAENLIASYLVHWTDLNHLQTDQEKSAYYNFVREKFNKKHSNGDFLFLNRTCYNGLIRYNQKGEFNSPFHFNRPGIHPDKLTKIILDWSKKLYPVMFRYCDYREIQTTAEDFLYIDPPYVDTKGIYHGNIDLPEFFEWLKNQKGNYALSLNGTRNLNDNRYKVPKEIYTEQHLLLSGNSSFGRLKNQTQDVVQESLYVRR